MKNVYHETPEWVTRSFAYILLYVFSLVLAYVAYSFIKWDMNLYNWTELERAVMVGVPAALLIWKTNEK